MITKKAAIDATNKLSFLDKYQQIYIEQLKEYNGSLKLTNAQLKKSKEELMSRISLQDMVSTELHNRIILVSSFESVYIFALHLSLAFFL